MRISIAQLNYQIGNFEDNLAKMLLAVEEAKSEGADLICFSELATCGYPPQDFLEFEDFLQRANASIDRLLLASEGIGIVVGTPTKNQRIEGKSLHNSVLLLYNGVVEHMQHKTLLPTYDIFDEYRYFEPAQTWSTVTFKGKKLALVVCEDTWDVGVADPIYNVIPLDRMMDEQPDLIINVSASPFSYAQPVTRLHMLESNVHRYGLPMFYINHCGAQTELIFDGGSMVMSPNAMVYDELPYFEECIRHYELDAIVANDKDHRHDKNKIALIHDALILGLRDYFRKLGFSKAILGLSGGIDSAVTLVLAQRALGSENVRVLLMPSQFSSGHSVDDAVALAKTLDVQYDIVPIKDMYDAFMVKLSPLFKDMPFNVTEENIQARVRGILNMAISNKFGNILLNTTNKSEMAVGYGTLYGDLCGGLSVLGDVYKTEVYELAAYINKDVEIIPHNSISKPPSAELRPDQKDSDSLPPYEVLDPLLRLYIEGRQGPKEIIEQGFDEKLVNRVLRMVNMNEFKRFQTPPVLRVSPKAFGMGRRVPIVAKYLS